jgi:hypothetical protein
MERHSTGAFTTGEVGRIELSYLLRQGLIKRGQSVYGSLSWTNGSSISFASSFTEGSRFIRLSYYNENSYSGERTHHDYKIQLTTIPSNLGKGEIIYFVCPSTGRRARILYRCYGSKIWKCRTAHQNRIYYESQQCSKLDLHNIRYWTLEKELDRCYKKSKKKVYHNYLRWAILPKALLKGINSDELRFP